MEKARLEFAQEQLAVVEAGAISEASSSRGPTIGEQRDNPRSRNNTSGSTGRNMSAGVGELNSRNNSGAVTIDRNDDTRVRRGPINAAKASDRLLTSSGLPCTKYVANVVDASGIVNTKQKLPGKTYSVEDAINMNKNVLPEATSNEQLDHLVRDYDQRTKGVVHALAEANVGYEIDIINDLNARKKETTCNIGIRTKVNDWGTRL